ncbi:hypothetical protein JW766_05120 [Candidatus Dojkabacteria bacterium]|nr:hypothetical protein [Candidatus Dojkabacteria bacterium]
MKNTLKEVANFGLTSGVMTCLGLMVGINAGVQSKVLVIGSVLTVAVADSLSDALGMHISEEAENIKPGKELWSATLVTFITKFSMGITFLFPLLILELSVAIIVNVVWGFLVILVLSYRISKDQKRRSMSVIFEHLAIAILVLVIAQLIGSWINSEL